jgi:hypothetical protein
MSGLKCNKLETECCFDKEILYNSQQPIGFEDWSKLITYCKCRATLPDKTSIDIRMYIDINGRFDNAAYTNFILNRYNEIL